MRYVDEYRDPAAVGAMSAAIARVVTRPWVLMEICGGQTNAILRYGLDALLPHDVTLVHGPGCPVCVTPVAHIDKAIEIALRPGVILASFGDMLRVPGTDGDLLTARSRGADVRVVHSPLDALALARAEPGREVVLFAIGFETTAPANAMAAYRARREGIGNFSMLVSHVLVPPAMDAILAADGNRIQGFLGAGHVCVVMGYADYEPIAARHGVPIVVTGFEPLDILEGVFLCLRQLEAGRAEVENQYCRSVCRNGNPPALAMIREVFRVVPRQWRGIGAIAASGLGLAPAYRDLDAEQRFGAVSVGTEVAGPCISGQVLRGEKKPPECQAFGTSCTPDRPLGVTMVSAEGACAAYHRHPRAGIGR